MLACEKQSSLEFARIATFMVERLIPPNDVQVVLSRHAAFLAGRPGGVRLQQPGGQYARLRLDGAMLDDAILSRADFGDSSMAGAQMRSVEHTSGIQSLMRI